MDTDYALRSLLYLGQAQGRTVSCSTVADTCRIPVSFAYKIMKRLVLAEMVNRR